MKKYVPVFLCFLAAPASAQAPIFSCKEGDGAVSYVSSRTPGAECKVVGVNHDPRWEHVTSSATGDWIRVDKQTMRRTGASSTAWVQYLHMKVPRKGPNYESVFKTLQRQTFDCVQMTVKLDAWSTFTEGDAYVDGGTSSHAQWEPVVPGTTQEAVYERLCLLKD